MEREPTVVTSKPARTLAVAALSIGLALGATACSAPQTLHPYTPAVGVNAEVTAGNQVPLKLRNVMILSRAEGQGALLGSLLSTQEDTLTQVSGQLVGGSGARPGQIAPAQPGVRLAPDTMTNLLDGPAVQLSAPGMVAGQTADLVLTFAKAGPVAIRVPVVDGSKTDFRTVSPSPAPTSATPSPSAAGTSTPSASAAGATPRPTATS